MGLILSKNRLILKHNHYLLLVAPFFNSRYVFLTHFCWNSGFAKVNFFAGHWTEKLN